MVNICEYWIFLENRYEAFTTGIGGRGGRANRWKGMGNRGGGDKGKESGDPGEGEKGRESGDPGEGKWRPCCGRIEAWGMLKELIRSFPPGVGNFHRSEER